MLWRAQLLCQFEHSVLQSDAKPHHPSAGLRRNRLRVGTQALNCARVLDAVFTSLERPAFGRLQGASRCGRGREVEGAGRHEQPRA